MTYKYEVVSLSGRPTFKESNFYSFHVPVSVGDKIQLRNKEITTVSSIEHREELSIIYCYIEPIQTNW